MDEPSPPNALLRHRAFARFLYVRIAASVALQMQAVAVGWQIYALTGSSFSLGLVGLVQFVPAVWLFLASGRVYAVNSTFTSTSNYLGDFRAGAAAALFGTIPAVLIGGFCAPAVVAISTRIFRELCGADRYEAAKP
jgi:hypothetical protein